jgi:hypothetical protein
MQMLTKGSYYWHSYSNVLDSAVCLCAFSLSVASLASDYDLWHHAIGTLLMCVAWINFAWLMTKLPKFTKTRIHNKISLMFMMMFRVISKVCIFMPVFAIFTMAFALCFHALFQIQEPFSNLGYSIMKTIGMTVGELDMSDMFFSDSDADRPPLYILSSLIFVAFLGVLTVSAMNLLVAMAVGDIRDLCEQSEVVAFRNLVDLILENQAMTKMYKRRYRTSTVTP